MTIAQLPWRGATFASAPFDPRRRVLAFAGPVIVNEHMRLLGTIEGNEDLIVRGRVEGTVRITGSITVEPGGLVAGEVHARTAQVYGAVYGNVSAAESIEVARSGQMIGDAIAPKVAIVPGAAFRGQVEMRAPDAELPGGARPAPALPAMSSQPAPRGAREEPLPEPQAAPAPVERERSRRTAPAFRGGPPQRPDRRAIARGPQAAPRGTGLAAAHKEPQPSAPPQERAEARPCQVPRLASLGRGPLKRR
jgi:cytoskeletal protein CcmA (bactofilin family)